MPRLPDVPSSAPIYDDITRPVTYPKLSCMYTADLGMVAKNNNVPHPDPVEHFAVHRDEVPAEVGTVVHHDSPVAYGSLVLALSVGVLIGLAVSRVCKCPRV